MAKSAHSTTFSTATDKELVATRVVDASRELIWKLHTDPNFVPQWMKGPEGWTMPVCEIDLRPGGSWHYVWQKDDGERMEMRGTFREVAPPERLVNTERWGGDYPETINTLELTENKGRTTIRTTVRYPSNEARERALATGMKEGWAESYVLLDDYVAKLQRTRAEQRPETRA